MTDYDETAARAWNDVPEPKNLPDGHYVLRLNGLFANEPKEEAKRQDPRISPRFTAVKALGDVDQKALKALGAGYQVALNDEIYKGLPLLYWPSEGGFKDKRKVIDLLTVFERSLPAVQEFLVTGDNGDRRVNPEIVDALRDAEVVGYVERDEYNGEERNIVTSFIPLSVAEAKGLLG
jgi:hypothetical protein